jgi:hypothetical protein
MAICMGIFVVVIQIIAIRIQAILQLAHAIRYISLSPSKLRSKYQLKKFFN